MDVIVVFATVLLFPSKINWFLYTYNTIVPVQQIP